MTNIMPGADRGRVWEDTSATATARGATSSSLWPTEPATLKLISFALV